MRTFNANLFNIRKTFLVIGVTAFILGSDNASSQTPKPIDVSTLKVVDSKSLLEVESFIEQWASSQIPILGRNDTAALITRFVAENAESSEYLALLRQFGARIAPEFWQSVLKQAENTELPEARGRLLCLMRSAPPDYVPSIAKWLSDTRYAENLVEQGKTNPKVREGIAGGNKPYRVRDIAFNVLHEIADPDKNSSARVYRTEEPIERDRTISQYHNFGSRLEDSRPKKESERAFIQSSPSKPPVVSNGEVPKPDTADETPPRSTLWFVWSAVIIAAISFVWLLVRKRK